LTQITLKEGERAIVIAISGSMEFQNFMLTNGILLGTILTKNYSPSYAKLVNFSVGGKMLSLRLSDFEKLEIVKI